MDNGGGRAAHGDVAGALRDGTRDSEGLPGQGPRAATQRTIRHAAPANDDESTLSTIATHRGRPRRAV